MAIKRVISSGGGGTSFASGGVTNNVIPKSNGAGALADSSITDNGTNVSTTEAILAPAGSATLPGYAFTGGANQNAAGMYWTSASTSILNTNGVVGFISALVGAGGAQIRSDAPYGWNSGTAVNGGSTDTGLRRRAAANISLGFAADVNGVPVAQTLGVQNAITGSDLAGSTFTIDAPLGTGLGAGAKIVLNRAIMKATGATAQTESNALAIGQSKTLSNTSATAQTIATIALGSNAGGGCAGTFTIVATDGTNFDAETQSFNVSFVNKATVVTVGTPAITASTAANNTGSATLGITAVANGNNIDIKVTPVFVTIVPTTVTLYPVITHSTNTVTFI